ncbi:hypothetical protein FM076_14050 [Streptomyces albus subsp. chlorinus]|uniref:hypothetical protein n=1 Tax=Streptomyces albus TaxID=1888 RepID=UPI00156F641B|nr:hypothetical protein [Streptomyces albus]NSC22250.1 hypothetical protein [Streptomyces albus subsp. chlorinus]
MSGRSSSSEPTTPPRLMDEEATAPIAADAVAFRAAHGAPATWSAEDFEVYLDLERPGAPAAGVVGGGAA